MAHSSHHKHSYYLIRHSERLAGFTEGDLELIAQVARYHRKREPVSSHREFTALSKPDRRRVRILAGLLRVGIALDRTYRRTVDRVHASVCEDSLTIDVEVSGGADVDIELFTARRNAGLLAEALGRAIVFRVVETGADRRRHPSLNST